MFDIGFWEISVIAVVALLVIGPERLPGVARQAGMWIGRIRGFVGSVQADINQEISKSEELKRLLEEQAKIKEIHEIIETSHEPSRMVESLGDEIENSLQGGSGASTQAIPPSEERSAASSAQGSSQSGNTGGQTAQAQEPHKPVGSVPRAQPIAPRKAQAQPKGESGPGDRNE